MSSPSSPPPPPPPPPPPGAPPPGAPPTGTPPPPPPPPGPANPSGAGAPPNVTSANYFFGFVITFVVLLLLFVGCGIGSWRRFRLIGTAWDERLQDMDGTFPARKRGRRRLVRPVFAEAWTHPQAARYTTPVAVTTETKWEGVQPISAAFVWSRAKLAACTRRAGASGPAQATTTGRGDDGAVRGMATTLRSYVLPRRSRRQHPPGPPPVTRPPPEAIQVAVMIAMPSPSLPSRPPTGQTTCVGHSGVGEYQIGVASIPWPSGEGP